MSPEKQRIRIAELCGYKWWTYDYRGFHVPEVCQLIDFTPVAAGYELGQKFRAIQRKSTHPEAFRKQFEYVPDYLNDLNAMHKAENIMDIDERAAYANLLGIEDPIYGHNAVLASADIRAEAFLKVFNAWEA